MSIQRKMIAQRDDFETVQEFENPFADIYPFSEIGRVIMESSTGNILRICHPDDSNFDIDGNPINFNPDTEELMVKFPAFYFKREWEGTTHHDSILDLVPGDVNENINGFKVHPAFVRPDGTVRPYVLVGATQGIKSNATYENGIFTILNFDLIAQNHSNNYNFSCMNIDVLSMIRTLYWIAFNNDRNPWNTIGRGSGYNTYPKLLITDIMKSGNRSGTIKYIRSDGSYINKTNIFGINAFWCKNSQVPITGLYHLNGKLFYTNDPKKFKFLDLYEEIDDSPLTENTFYGFGYLKRFNNQLYHLNLTENNINNFYCKQGGFLNDNQIYYINTGGPEHIGSQANLFSNYGSVTQTGQIYITYYP